MISNVMPAGYIIFLTLLHAAGCVTANHDQRLGENLWEVGLTDIERCEKSTSDDDCVAALRPDITKRAQEICGAQTLAEVKGCTKTQRRGLYAVVCRALCTPNVAVTGEVSSGLDLGLHSDQSRRRLARLISSPAVAERMADETLTALAQLGRDIYLVSGTKKEVCVAFEGEGEGDGEGKGSDPAREKISFVPLSVCTTAAEN